MKAQSSIKSFLFAIRYAVKKEPGLYCLTFITSISYAVASKFIFLHIGQIINFIPDVISAGNGSLHEILSLLFTLLALYIVQTIAYGIYQNIANVLLPSRMDIQPQRDIVQLTDSIPLHKFDLPDFCNTYSEATSTIANLHSYVTSNIFIIQCAVSLIITGIVLFQNSFLLLLVFILSGAAAVLITRQNAQLNFELWERSNAKRRLNSYIADLFFVNNGNKEIRLFHLAPYFVDKYRKMFNLSPMTKRK